MNRIPWLFQSSVNPEEVSLTIQSVGKSVGFLIATAGALGWIDPMIAGQAWGGFVASIITGVPAGFAFYHAGLAVWGALRKIANWAVILYDAIRNLKVAIPPANDPAI